MCVYWYQLADSKAQWWVSLKIVYWYQLADSKAQWWGSMKIVYWYQLADSKAQWWGSLKILMHFRVFFNKASEFVGETDRRPFRTSISFGCEQCGSATAVRNARRRSVNPAKQTLLFAFHSHRDVPFSEKQVLCVGWLLLHLVHCHVGRQ